MLLAAGVGLGCGAKTDEPPVGSCHGIDGDPLDLTWGVPTSCAFVCGEGCSELTTPYACPAMAPWTQMPHDAACGCYTGATPAVKEGSCTASEPSGEALRKTGVDESGQGVLPDGHVLAPAGSYASLDEDDLHGTFPMSLRPIPGTSLMLSSDGGIIDNTLRLLDIEALAKGGEPSKAHFAFQQPSSLFHGVAWLAPSTALASGGGDGMVYGFEVDTVGGTIARDDTRDIDLGGPTSSSYGDARWYSGPIAVSNDGTRLLVAPSTGASEIQVRSLAAESWGEKLGTAKAHGVSVFEIAVDPFDASGKRAYATQWDGDELLEIDLSIPKTTRAITIGKNPEGIAFLDETFMVVAAADVDALGIVDRVAGELVSSVALHAKDEPHGQGPTSLAFDAAHGRLYATLSGVNALAVFDVTLGGGKATMTAAGRIPTAWWPTAVEAEEDGSLVILSGKGTGTGPDATFYPWSQGPVTQLMHGGVQHVPYPTADDLADMTAVAEVARKLAVTEGYPEVSCPAGADDFPVPLSPEAGPSALIKHVVFVVRENKTYDAVFGDLPDTDGDPSLVMAPDEMDTIWSNSRLIAKEFVNFDNFYTDAEQSVQGHVWTAFGRTTDAVERGWLTSWGRGTRPPLAGVSDQGKPEEGSLFNAFERASVPYANMGEIVGVADTPLDSHYPGLFTTIGKPDTEKACYIAARARATCDLPPFVYAVMPNDHTFGGDENSPHPGVMIAVNDEATGLVLDAVSHSPMWPDTLVIVTEDDPQDGGDHVDIHRTLLFMASPWTKRGYVSHGHYDMASVHKLIVTILGIPYPNEQVAQAPLPLDAFTSTPDYAPYTYRPRTYDQPCNPAGTKAAAAALDWDFREVDEQPGVGRWAWHILHNGSHD